MGALFEASGGVYISAREARGPREPLETGEPLRDGRRETDGRETSVRSRALELARCEIRERDARRNQINDARTRRRPAR